MPALVPSSFIEELLRVRFADDHHDGLSRHTTLTTSKVGVLRVFVGHIVSLTVPSPTQYARSRTCGGQIGATNAPR